MAKRTKHKHAGDRHPDHGETPIAVAPNSSRWMNYAPVLLLTFTAIVFCGCLKLGITDIDDDYYIVRNPYLRDWSFSGIEKIFTKFYSFNYHPLTTISNLIEFRLWGLNPLPYHFFNLVLHLFNVWSAFKLVEALSRNRVTAFFVAALFAVHPAHVESVVWIAERKDVLYAAFYLTSLRCYLSFLDNGRVQKQLLLAGLAFIASVLSKSAAVTLPIVLFVFDWYRGRTFDRRIVVEKIPFLAISVVFGVLAIMSQKYGGAIDADSLQFGTVNRIVLIFAGLFSYFRLLVLPLGLTPIHYYPVETSGWLAWYFYAGIPVVIAVLIFGFKNGNRDLRFGLLFFLATISVMLQYVPVGMGYYAERYTYLSYIGLFFPFVQWMVGTYRAPKTRYYGYVLWAVVVVCSIITFLRIPVWTDTEAVFSDLVNKNAGNRRISFVYYYWGNALLRDNNIPEALEKYDLAVATDPAFAPGYSSRGNLRQRQGEWAMALRDFNEALRLQPRNPFYADLAGWASLQLKDTATAVLDFERCVTIDPHNAEAWNNLGWISYSRQKDADALTFFGRSIREDSLFKKPRLNRAALFAARTDYLHACYDYDTLIRLNESDSLALFNRGIMKLQLLDSSGACADWQRSLQYGNSKAAALIARFCGK